MKYKDIIVDVENNVIYLNDYQIVLTVFSSSHDYIMDIFPNYTKYKCDVAKLRGFLIGV